MPIKRYTRRVVSTHPYYNYHHRRFTEIKRRKWPWLLFLPFLVAILFTAVLYARPLPSVAAVNQLQELKTVEPSITWPQGSQAAFGTTDQGLLASKPGETPKPTASTAKVITVLTVLEKKPLKLGEQGPKITITQSDVANYDSYYAKNGSLAQVAVGEELTEYQMLQGILLPSANNYADTLAIWAFGSLENYHTAATELVRRLDMKDTVIGSDASGFSPTTVSTASDLTKLAVVAMKHPVVAQIALQESVNLPVAGIKNNTNYLLGSDGVVGLKTGNTDEAGGVYVFAAKYALDKTHSTIIVGAVQGEPTVIAAMMQAKSLLAQIKPRFIAITPIAKGQPVAVYHAPWGQQTKAVAVRDINIMTWPGKKLETHLSVANIGASSVAGSSVGSVKVGGYMSDVVLRQPLGVPDWQWRIWHAN